MKNISPLTRLYLIIAIAIVSVLILSGISSSCLSSSTLTTFQTPIATQSISTTAAQGQVSVTPTLGPSPIPMVGGISVPQPTSTKTIGATIQDSSYETFGKTIGTLLGTTVVFLGLGTLLLLVIIFYSIYIFFSRGNQKRKLELQVNSLINNEWKEDPKWILIIHQALKKAQEETQEAIEFLTGEERPMKGVFPPFFLRLPGKTLSFHTLADITGKDLNAINQIGNSTENEIKVQFSIGPLSVNSSRFSIIQNIIAPIRFRLLITVEPDQQDKEKYTFTNVLFWKEVLFWKDHVIYMKTVPKVEISQIKDVILYLLYDVAWKMQQNQPNKSLYIPQEDSSPPEISIIRGIYHLSKNLQDRSRNDQGILALKYFEEATIIDTSWSLHARFLGVLTRLIEKKEMLKTTVILDELASQFSNKKYQPLFNYYRGQCRLFTYNRAQYQEAINNFLQVKRPMSKLWEWSKTLWIFVLRRAGTEKVLEYILYCLAQSGIAMVNALSIDRNHDFPAEVKSNIGLIEQISSKVNSMREELQRTRDLIGTQAFTEVEWRLYNAEIVFRLFSRTDFQVAEELVSHALEIAPHALDVLANHGSLLLLQATINSPKSIDYKKVEEASTIFEELEAEKWDLGFIYYRLGMIRRAQGRFDEASEYLNRANIDDIRDVPVTKIEAQLKKCKEESTELLHTEVY